MGLLDSFAREEAEYINISDAITTLQAVENEEIEIVVKFLLGHEFEGHAPAYYKNDFDKIIESDQWFSGSYQNTWRALRTLLGMYSSEIPMLGNGFTEDDFKRHYWKKSDFFNFEPIKGLGLPEGKEWLPKLKVNNAPEPITPIRGGHSSPAVDHKKQNEELKQHYQKQLQERDAEITRLNNRILELESQVAVEVPETLDLLAAITNSNAEYYAPDLAYAVQLWKHVYLGVPKNDSHNNKANNWVKNNTPYSGEQEDKATRRIREITSPLTDWHSSRKKALNNI